MAETATITATVEAIDRATRGLVLRGPRGNLVNLVADEQVRNFDQIQVGDTVTAEVFEAVAVYLESATGPASAEVGGAVALAPIGSKPGLAAVKTTRVTAIVEAIDHANRTAVLRGPKGRSVAVRVDPNVRRFNELKVGDEVVVEHTESVAISVRTP